MNQPTLEQEARHYWSVMRQMNLLRRAKMAYPDDLHDSISELELIAQYTDWKLLKRLCVAGAAALAPTAALAEAFVAMSEIASAVGACL